MGKETRKERFKRVAQKRVQNIINSIRSLSGLSNKKVYEWETEQLEKITNIKLPETDRADMQKVLNTYPARLSMHTIRQMRVSGNVAYQYLPFIQELDAIGHTNTWIGQFHQGLLEQMYQNRVIFLLNMSCPEIGRAPVLSV